MRHLTIIVPTGMLVLSTQFACDLGSRSIGSDDGALPGGETYETRVHFDAEYEGDPAGIALADDGSFVVMVLGYEVGSNHATRFHHYDPEGNAIGVFEDPTLSTSSSSGWMPYRLESTGDEWLFLARELNGANDDQPQIDRAHVRLTKLASDGTFESLAAIPCHHDNCRMTYEPTIDTTWTVTEIDDAQQAQRWSLTGEPQGPPVMLPSPGTDFYTTATGALLVAALDQDAGPTTVSSIEANGELNWTTELDTTPYDDCRTSMVEQAILVECETFVEGEGRHQHRASVDTNGLASPFTQWTGDPATVAGPGQRSVAFGPGTLTIYDAAGAPLETGPGPFANYLGGHSDVAGNRIAILNAGGEFDPVSVAVLELD